MPAYVGAIDQGTTSSRFIVFDRDGAILPGIGGAATRAGYTEVLYVTELAGLALMWAGYRMSVAPAPVAPPRTAPA